MRAHRNRHIDHLALGPQWVHHGNGERDQPRRIGGNRQGGQIDGDAVQPVMQVFPAIIPGAREFLPGMGIAEGGWDENMHQRRRARQPNSGGGGGGVTGAGGGLCGAAGQRHHGFALVRGIAASDELVQPIERGKIRRERRTNGIAQLELAGGFARVRDVIGP